MKKLLSLLMLLCMVCTGVWAESSRLIASTNETTPEYVYYIKGTSNGYYWSSNTTPTRTTENITEFAFFSVSGVTDSYYIKCVSGTNAGKWVSYTKQSGYSGKRDFIIFVENKSDANFFHFGLNNGNQLSLVYYNIRPYNNTDVSGYYLNWFQGVGGSGYAVDGNQTMGIHNQAGSDDAGSRWTLIAKPKFQYAASAAEVNHWYKLKIRTNRYLSFNDDENIYNSVTDAPTEYTSEYYFGFVGSPFDGFKIINMAAGRDRAMTSRVVASDCLTMAEDINNATQYIFETNSNLVFREKSTQNAYLNSIDNSKGLGYWVHGSSYNDGGSSLTIEEAEVGTTYDITFNYQLNGAAIGTRQVVVKAGTTPTYVLPAYVEAIDAPSISAANANASYTINTRYKNDATYPFEIGKYFFLKNNTSNRYMAVADETGKLTLSSTTAPTEANAELYSFRFEGDWLNGFKIYHQGGTHFTTKDSYGKNSSQYFEAQQEALHGDADKGIGDIWYIKYGTHNRGNATTGYYMVSKKWRVSPVYYSSGHTYASHLAELNYTGNTFTFIKSPYNIVGVTANLVGVWSDDERVNLGSVNIEVVENRTFDAETLKLPEFYAEPTVVGTDNLVVTESNKTFNIELTPHFPVEEGVMYHLTSETFNGSYNASEDEVFYSIDVTNPTVAGRYWTFQHVANTENLFTVKNVGWGKYMRVASATNQTKVKLNPAIAEWTSGTGETSYFRITPNGNGFNLQHPGNVQANVGSHVNGWVGEYTNSASPTNGASRLKVTIVSQENIMTDFATVTAGATSTTIGAGAPANQATLLENIKTDGAQTDVLAYFNPTFKDYVSDGKYYRIKFNRANEDMTVIGHANSEGVYQIASGSDSGDGEVETRARNNSDLSQLWQIKYIKDVDGVANFALVSPNANGYSTAYPWGCVHMQASVPTDKGVEFERIVTTSASTWAMKDNRVTDGNKYYNCRKTSDNSNQGITNWSGSVSDPGNCVTIEEVTTIPLTIKTSKWASVCYPVAVTLPTNLTAYAAVKVSTEGIGIDALPNNVIPANTPVIVTTSEDLEAPKTYYLTIGGDEYEVEPNLFTGTTITRQGYDHANAYNYGLSNGSFVRMTGTTVAANKAFIHNEENLVPAGGSVRVYIFDDTVTGVQSTSAAAEQGAYYDLNGHIVAYPTTGVYVRNGKKIFVK